MKFRYATMDDCDLLYAWANDPTSREQSFHSETISYQDHIKWFNEKVGSPDSKLLIFLKDDQEIGLVRMDKSGEEWVISINLDRNYRGKGLAVTMIEVASNLVSRQYAKPVAAFIKPDNKASIKVFQYAGYKKTAQQIINGHITCKYVFEK